MTQEDFMRLAIHEARTAPTWPFGAAIVRSATGDCIAVGVNRSGENPILHRASAGNKSMCYAPARTNISMLYRYLNRRFEERIAYQHNWVCEPLQ